MRIEINLWLEKGREFRGLVNLDRGSSQPRIKCLLHRELFINEGVQLGLGEFIDLDESSAFEDREAKYAWIYAPAIGFVSWNEKESFMKIFINNQHLEIPLVTKVRTGVYVNQPTISFRNFAKYIC